MAERYQPHPRPRGPRKGYLYVKVDRKRRRRERKREESRPSRAEREACKPRYVGGWPAWMIRSR
jgi:hypothetical protein